MPPDTLAARLRAARKAANMTQAHLAALAGVGRVSIAHIETGRIRDPGASVVLALARALDMDPRELMPEVARGE